MTRPKYIFLILIIISSAKICAQSCEKMKGDWVNELGSVLQIDSINKQGDIIGVYRSSTGVDGKEFKLKGYVNTSEEYPTEKNISFAVRWIGYGSITSWSGYCTQLNNKDQIKTMWHLVRSGKEFDWERVITNASVFTPKNK